MKNIKSTALNTTDVCSTNFCGPNSQCRNVNGIAVCSCQSGFMGSPPNCRPECVQSSECPADRACINQKCQDPCPSACGQNTECRVINRSPMCTCNPGFSGDPFTICFPAPSKKFCQFQII